VTYYNSIPTTIPVSNSTGVLSGGATSDQAFWKDYIDFVLGAGVYAPSAFMYGAQSGNSNTGGGSTLYYNNPSSSNLAPQITSLATLTAAPKATTNITGASNTVPIVITTSAAHNLITGATINISGITGNLAANGNNLMVTRVNATQFSIQGSTGNGNYITGGTWIPVAPSTDYTDTPIHPRMQFWFGPLSMLAYLKQAPTKLSGIGNWLPGTCYEAQSWQLKVGISAALQDIQTNHPNDLASLSYFSDSEGYHTARVGMGTNYNQMQNALFFPYSLLSNLSSTSATTLPFSIVSPSTTNPAGLSDISDTLIPNAGTSTCPTMGMMVSFNQLGNATDNSVTPTTTYQGRKTACKVVIYETDGCPNMTCTGALTGSGGPGNYYYANIGGVSGTGIPTTTLSSSPKTAAAAVVQQIVASTSASTPGFSSPRNPAYVHAIAFGDLFEADSTSALTPAALRFLAAVQIYGNTSQWAGGAVPAPGTMASWYNDNLDYNAYYVTPQPFKVITGPYATRIANIGTCIQTIMQSGVQIALIQ
jgi:hypothetical protein